MTTPAEPNERDWDAEFAAITGHLDDIVVDGPPPRARGANRDTFTSTSRQTDRRDARDSHDEGSATSPTEGVSGPLSSTSVPGFRAQWRVPAHGSEVSNDARPTPPSRSGAAHADPRPDEAQLPGDDGDFVPAPPQPLETGDPATVIMLGCFVVGPLWLLYLTLFDRDTATMWWALAALTLVAGFVLAVARQPRTRDDDGDDGARV